jgi:hypothetical protein
MIKLKGIKNVVTEAKNNLSKNNLYLQVNVDKSTGRVWSDLHCSIGQNSWSEYKDSNILNCGNISDPQITMADLKAMVERRINRCE